MKIVDGIYERSVDYYFSLLDMEQTGRVRKEIEVIGAKNRDIDFIRTKRKTEREALEEIERKYHDK